MIPKKRAECPTPTARMGGRALSPRHQRLHVSTVISHAKRIRCSHRRRSPLRQIPVLVQLMRPWERLGTRGSRQFPVSGVFGVALNVAQMLTLVKQSAGG